MRNIHGLTQRQIENAIIHWKFITQPSSSDKLAASALHEFSVNLDVSNACKHGSKTVFLEDGNIVRLGADAYPGSNVVSANSVMSLLACLCHELSHAQRYHMGFRRDHYDVRDEAETSIHASYMPFLSSTDRRHLVEDAKQRLDSWVEEESQE
ncbi:MAG: hypothetical protein GY862_20000 [Gammaproteobacteria bacterium]|nr:hypothetical protein [Gammaproteobacteria bacterium]